MGLLKTGCLGVVVVTGVIVVVGISLSKSGNKPVEVPAPQTQDARPEKPAEDPVKKKFGMTEKELKSCADEMVKNLVRQHLHFPADAVISVWNNEIKFFEYEFFDEKTKKMSGTVAGFNISNKCSVTCSARSEKHSYAATLRYDPRSKKWSLISFSLDGEKLNYQFK